MNVGRGGASSSTAAPSHGSHASHASHACQSRSASKKSLSNSFGSSVRASSLQHSLRASGAAQKRAGSQNARGKDFSSREKGCENSRNKKVDTHKGVGNAQRASSLGPREGMARAGAPPTGQAGNCTNISRRGYKKQVSDKTTSCQNHLPPSNNMPSRNAHDNTLCSTNKPFTSSSSGPGPGRGGWEWRETFLSHESLLL